MATVNCTYIQFSEKIMFYTSACSLYALSGPVIARNERYKCATE